MIQKRPKLKTKDRTHSEQKLIEAAEDAFSQNGFEGSTTREIAGRACVNVALINRYFKGKYGLLIAVIERNICELQKLRISNPKSSLVEECSGYVTDRFLHMTKNVDFFKIVVAQFITDEKFLKRYQESMLLEFVSASFAERLQEFINAKKVNAQFDPVHLIDVLERHLVATVLFEVIIRKVNKEKALKGLREFVKNYVRQFEK